MPCHHTQHVQNVGPNLFVHNENIAYIMPRVTTCAVMSCTHHTHAGKLATLCICGTPGITYGHAIHASQMIFIKITTSHFSSLNMKIANQNVPKRILIAMHNKNKAVCNENFRICAEEPIAPLYKW